MPGTALITSLITAFGVAHQGAVAAEWPVLCKPDESGQKWRCARWEPGRVEVFSSAVDLTRLSGRIAEQRVQHTFVSGAGGPDIKPVGRLAREGLPSSVAEMEAALASGVAAGRVAIQALEQEAQAPRAVATRLPEPVTKGLPRASVEPVAVLAPAQLRPLSSGQGALLSKPAVQPPAVASASGAASAVSMPSPAAAPVAQPTYTLQLAACIRVSCEEEAQRLRIPNLELVRLEKAEQRWTVLTYGAYGTVAEARAAAAQLRQAHRLRQEPWVRPLASLTALREQAPQSDQAM